MKCPLEFWEEELGSGTPLAKVTTARVEKAKLKLATQHKKSTVNKYLAVLKAFFSWQMVQGNFTYNPVRKIKFYATNNEIVRYLDHQTEYPELLEKARQVRWYLPYMIKLSVHTGLRKRNLLHLRWRQCNFRTRTIRTGTDAKNDRPVTVLLNESAFQTLQELKLRTGKSPLSLYT
jgi:integrase